MFLEICEINHLKTVSVNRSDYSNLLSHIYTEPLMLLLLLSGGDLTSPDRFKYMSWSNRLRKFWNKWKMETKLFKHNYIKYLTCVLFSAEWVNQSVDRNLLTLVVND